MMIPTTTSAPNPMTEVGRMTHRDLLDAIGRTQRCHAYVPPTPTMTPHTNFESMILTLRK